MPNSTLGFKSGERKVTIEEKAMQNPTFFDTERAVATRKAKRVIIQERVTKNQSFFDSGRFTSTRKATTVTFEEMLSRNNSSFNTKREVTKREAVTNKEKITNNQSFSDSGRFTTTRKATTVTFEQMFSRNNSLFKTTTSERKQIPTIPLLVGLTLALVALLKCRETIFFGVEKIAKTGYNLCTIAKNLIVCSSVKSET